MSLRWDKFIWSVRLAKTRSQASEAISKGKIRVNGTQIKPSKEPKVGDTIFISHNSAVFSYKILNLIDKRVGAKLVADYLLETTTDEEREKFRLYKLAQSAYRENGTGKPTKKDRRELDGFLENWEE